MMKKNLLLGIGVLLANSLTAQVLWSDDFESYELGNFTDQGGWIRDGGVESWVQITNLDEPHSKSIQMQTTPNNDSGIFVTHYNDWATRDVENNIISVNYDFYTGQLAEGYGLVVVGTDEFDIVMEMGWNVESNSLYIAGPGIEIPLLENPQADSWYHFEANYNTETGEVRARLDDGEVVTGTIDAGLVPNVFDFSCIGVSTIGIDNVVVEAVNSGEMSVNTELNLNATTIYPNPVKDFVQIQAKNTITEVQCFDVNGQLLQSVKNSSKMNVESLPKGVYVLKIAFENGKVETKKLIKK